MTPATGSAAPAVRAGRREWVALFVLALAVLLIAVDATVLFLALPFISEQLRPSATGLLWIGDAYSFMLAGLLVTMGSLGDRIGRKKLLLGGAVGFAVASVLAAYAPSAGLLIAARAVLGLAGATIMPSTLSIVRNMFTDDRQRTLAIGVWSSVVSAGVIIGPIIGGVLLEHFWWGSVFLLNLPVMALLLILGIPLVPESRDPAPGAFDLPSAGLSLVGVVPLVYAVKELAVGGTPGGILAGLVVGGAGLSLFVRRQRRLAAPMVDMSLFRHRAFTGSILANLCSVFALAGLVFFLSQYFQLVQGLSPIQAALREMPAMLGALVMSIVAGLLVRRFSRAGLASGGLVIAAVGLAALTVVIAAGASYPPMIVGLVLIGVGLGAAETITVDCVMASVPKEKAGAASAISETAYELGNALGIAVLGSVLTAVYQRSLTLPPGLGGDAANAARGSLGGALDTAGRLSGGLAGSLAEAARAAFTTGIVVSALLATVLLGCAALIAWRMLPRELPSDTGPSSTDAGTPDGVRTGADTDD